jgi:hypothetical protein
MDLKIASQINQCLHWTSLPGSFEIGEIIKGTRRGPDADTGGRWFESLIFINHPKGLGKRMVVDRQQVKTSSESRRYSVAGRLEVRAGRMVRQAGTVWQAGSRSGQAEWSGRPVQSAENRQGSKPGGLAKENRKGRSTRKTCWLTWNIRDELAQTDRKQV